MPDRRTVRTLVLSSLGADASQIEELLRYNEMSFRAAATENCPYPLPDEPFIKVWEQYAQEVEQSGTLHVLAKYLVQLRFPVLPGMSKNDDYLCATRRGPGSANIDASSGLKLWFPEQCQVVLHQTPGGRIPLIVTANRDDFVLLVQALSKHNEPVPVPGSMGAAIISGYNNWHRIQLLRAAFETAAAPSASWEEEFQRIKLNKQLYQDRFIILSSGPYSGVDASELGLEEEQWRTLSLAIRREHECVHYFTRRAFGSMQNKLIDEMIADYWAITQTLGAFRADWFLRFFGLEGASQYRAGGRLQNYRGNPPLTDGSFLLLQQLVRQAARNLEQFDHRCTRERQGADAQPAIFVALTALTAEEMASDGGETLLSESFLAARERCARSTLTR
jgi:uncharacterized protein DUF7005